jgi:tRNA-dihydrouridine synthase 4
MHRESATGEDGGEEAANLLPQEMLREYEGVNACGAYRESFPTLSVNVLTLSSLETAPMVRYGKLPFRQLVSEYETQLVWTPMMLCVFSCPLCASRTSSRLSVGSAAEFSRSAIARDSDFSTNTTERGTFFMTPRHAGAPVAEWDDSPERRGILSERVARTKRQRKVRGRLIIQFAANDPVQLADAAELAKPWVDGIDLNCGAFFQPLPPPSSFPSLIPVPSPQVALRNGHIKKESAVLYCASQTWCEILYERRSSD